MAFLKNASNTMNELRKSKEFTDVSLKIGDEIYDVHKAQLAASSPVLRALFSENWLNEAVPELNSENVYPEIGEILIEYLYTGEIDVNEDNASSLLVASHYLQLDELLDMSEKAISETVSYENAFYFFRVAYRYERNILMARCIEEMEVHHEQVFRDKSTLDFEPDEMMTLLKNLRAKNKIEGLKEFLYGCVIEWTKADVEKRTCELSGLMQNLPMQHLKPEFLLNTVAKEKLFEQLPGFCNFLVEELSSVLEKLRNSKKRCRMCTYLDTDM